MTPLRKLKRAPVLIANRGEIAIRIARTCQAMGFPTVAVYSDADRFAEHTKVCDQAYWIGTAEPKESYLNAERIIAVAKAAGAKFVHPGYGFLSERPHFVEACEKAGIRFIGPSAEVMRRMGDKISAREVCDELGIPRVPGSKGAVRDAAEAAKIAKEIGYPVLLKASAGGGGKGMRVVSSEKEIESALQGAKREASSAFGDDAVYVEKLILEPHHIEIQVFGDGKGGAVHLGERECSVQRRHQKVWEESPSPLIEKFKEARHAMGVEACKIASHLKYEGAGTIEFVTDSQANFYFLEMNTRLQVEHPVTEWVTGVDLVAWQLQLASGQMAKLPSVPVPRGHALEARIYAEDPYSFLPAPGQIGLIQAPTGPFVRWDSAFSSSGEVSVHYDPMIAKLSVWGGTRDEAIDRMRVALDELRVEPPLDRKGVRQGSLKTNIEFLRKLVRNEAVRAGQTTTGMIQEYPELTQSHEDSLTREAAIAVSAYQFLSKAPVQTDGVSVKSSTWSRTAIQEGVRL